MTNLDKTCLAAVDADKDELMLSSSGGAFSVLARMTLSHGGTVYGHAFDEGMHVGCVRVDSLDGLAVLRGSKYVQSDMGDSMSLVRDDLKAGREVLFSGTPCQVDGLLAFLGGTQDGLLTVDIVCHGVIPSQHLFFLAIVLKWVVRWQSGWDRCQITRQARMVGVAEACTNYYYYMTPCFSIGL